MKNLGYYTKDAIESRMSKRQAIGHKVDIYTRHEEYGVIKIYYKIDIKEGLATIGKLLIIPNIFYNADRDLNNGRLCSKEGTHYFDASSGKEISQTQAQENKNKNKEAILLDVEGNALLRQGKYQEAIEKFQLAYQTCTSGYSEESRYKSKIDMTKNNWAEDINRQGLALMNRNDFGGAANKFNDAYRKCTSNYENGKIFQDNMNHAQAEAQNKTGDLLYNSGNYAEAIGAYETAYEKCPASKDSDLNRYISNKRKAQAELDALRLKEQGDQEYNSGRYQSAQVKYQEAHDKSGVTDNKSSYITLVNNAKAEELNTEGNLLYSSRKYEEAYKKFEQAFQTCTSGYDKRNIFKNNRDLAKNNWAEEINKQGLALMNRNDFESAANKFNDAYKKCTSNYKNERMFQDNMNHARAEAHNKTGDLLYNSRNYAEAIGAYETAYKKCPASRHIDLNKYTSNKRKSQAELDALRLKEQGDQECNSGRYQNAQVKYQEAFNKSCLSDNKITYMTCINKAVEGFKTVEGDLLYSQGNYKEALTKYQEAYMLQKSYSVSIYDNFFSYLWSIFSPAQVKEFFKHTANIKKAQNELDATIFENLGDNAFDSGRYFSAKYEYERANSKTSIVDRKSTYSSKICKAEIELAAAELKILGDKEFNSGKYESAIDKYQQAHDKTTIASYKIAFVRCIAEAFNAEGEILYNTGKYAEAITKYQTASKINPFSETESKNNFVSFLSYMKNLFFPGDSSKYCANIAKAKTELDAITLKELGDKEFYSGKYDRAKAVYQQAHNKSNVAANKTTYATFIKITEVELEAERLKKLGDLEYNSYRYENAKIKYEQAYHKSSVAANKSRYATFINRADIELDAARLKKLGDLEYRSGRYDNAKVKYKQAYDKSYVSSNQTAYGTCFENASIEQEGKLSQELGDKEFVSCRYESAKDKYQQAYDKSINPSNKSIYDACVNKAEGFIFWTEGWNAENRGDSNEGASKFQKANGFFKRAHQLAPDDLQYAKWYHMSCFKLEGNELFNQGLKLQQDGIKLMEQGKEFELHDNFELAEVKFKNAKAKFSKSLENFKMGVENDQRFTSCIDFVEEQLNEVLTSINIIEQRILGQALLNIETNVSDSIHRAVDSSDSHRGEVQMNFLI